jgi:CheY-like chemotaxis protein
MLLDLALTRSGLEHSLEVLTDGDQAIAHLTKLNAASAPELVVIDLTLPKRDGMDVVTRYRNTPALAESRIVVLTSSLSPREQQRAHTQGVDLYLHKPVDLDGYANLGKTIRGLFEARLRAG